MRREFKLCGQGWSQAAKRWLPKTSNMQHKMTMRKSLILDVALRRRSIVRMDATPCFQKLEIHFFMLSFRKAWSLILWKLPLFLGPWPIRHFVWLLKVKREDKLNCKGEATRTKKVYTQPTRAGEPEPGQRTGKPRQRQSANDMMSKSCWKCEDCPKLKKESTGRSTHQQVSTKMVSIWNWKFSGDTGWPIAALTVRLRRLQIQVQDQGSKPQKAKVVVGGVPMVGVIAVAKLHKKAGWHLWQETLPNRWEAGAECLFSRSHYGDRCLRQNGCLRAATEVLGIVIYHPLVNESEPRAEKVGATVTTIKVQLVVTTRATLLMLGGNKV